MSKYLLIVHDAQDGSQAGRAELIESLVAALGMPRARLEELFSSLPAILCSELSEVDAQRYSRVLDQLGAVTEIIEADRIPALQKSEVGADDTSVSFYSPPINPSASEKNSHQVSSIVGNDMLSFDEEESAPSSSSRSGSVETLFEATQDIDGIAAGENEALSQFMHQVGTSEATGPEIVSSGEGALNQATDVSNSEAGNSASVQHTECPPSADQPSTEPPSAPQSAFAVKGAAFATAVDVSSEVNNAPAGVLTRLRSGDFIRENRQFALIGLLCLVLLVGAPSFFATSKESISITVDVSKLLAQQAQILGRKSEAGKDDKNHSPTYRWRYEGRIEGGQLKVELYERGNGFERGYINLALDKPQPLTKEEFVNGKTDPLWLTRCEGVIQRHSAVTNSETNSATASENAPTIAEGSATQPTLNSPDLNSSEQLKGPVKVYISDSKGNDIVVAHAAIRIDKDQSAAKEESALGVKKIQWEIRSVSTEAVQNSRLLERVSKTEYRVFLNGEVKLERDQSAQPEVVKELKVKRKNGAKDKSKEKTQEAS